MGRHISMKRIGDILFLSSTLLLCVWCCGCKSARLPTDSTAEELPASILGLNREEVLSADKASEVIDKILPRLSGEIDEQSMLCLREQIASGFAGMYAVWLEDANAHEYIIVSYFPEDIEGWSFGYRYYSFLEEAESGRFYCGGGCPITLIDRR